jgi:hypothetical protein
MHRRGDIGREVEAGVFAEREGVHVAAQQHRGPGAATGQQGVDPAGRLVDGHVEGQRLDGFEHLLLGDGQEIADLRPAMQCAA